MWRLEDRSGNFENMPIGVYDDNMSKYGYEDAQVPPCRTIGEYLNASRQTYTPYSETYHPGWQNHSHYNWMNEGASRSQQYEALPPPSYQSHYPQDFNYHQAPHTGSLEDSPYAETYDLGWQNPNFSWSNEEPASPQQYEAPPLLYEPQTLNAYQFQEETLADTLSQFMQSQSQFMQSQLEWSSRVADDLDDLKSLLIQHLCVQENSESPSILQPLPSPTSIANTKESLINSNFDHEQFQAPTTTFKNEEVIDIIIYPDESTHREDTSRVSEYRVKEEVSENDEPSKVQSEIKEEPREIESEKREENIEIPREVSPYILVHDYMTPSQSSLYKTCGQELNEDPRISIASNLLNPYYELLMNELRPNFEAIPQCGIG